MTDPTPTPNAPVPPDELLIRTYQAAYQPAWERGEFHGAHVDGLRAIYAQAMQEREELINLLCESAKIADSYRNIPSPGYGMLSLGVHAMQCRAAAERLGRLSPEPEPMPTDPHQRISIICAHCGVDIDFSKRTVYSNSISYLCKDCAVGEVTQ
jgi:hypothetical protein